MAMDFFERQEQARANSRKIVLLFLLTLPCVIAAVYVVSVVVYAVGFTFFAFWRSVFVEIHSSSAGTAYFISLWQPALFLCVAGGTLTVVFGGSLYKLKQLAPGGHVVALLLGGERFNPETKKLEELRHAGVGYVLINGGGSGGGARGRESLRRFARETMPLFAEEPRVFALTGK